MVKKCAAFGCNSGYKNHVQQDDDIKITFFTLFLLEMENYDFMIGGLEQIRVQILYHQNIPDCVRCTSSPLILCKSVHIGMWQENVKSHLYLNSGG